MKYESLIENVVFEDVHSLSQAKKIADSIVYEGSDGVMELIDDLGFDLINKEGKINSNELKEASLYCSDMLAELIWSNSPYKENGLLEKKTKFTKKMEDCVSKVKKQHGENGKYNPWAVCTASLKKTGSKVRKENNSNDLNNRVYLVEGKSFKELYRERKTKQDGLIKEGVRSKSGRDVDTKQCSRISYTDDSGELVSTPIMPTFWLYDKYPDLRKCEDVFSLETKLFGDLTSAIEYKPSGKKKDGIDIMVKYYNGKPLTDEVLKNLLIQKKIKVSKVDTKNITYVQPD